MHFTIIRDDGEQLEFELRTHAEWERIAIINKIFEEELQKEINREVVNSICMNARENHADDDIDRYNYGQ